MQADKNTAEQTSFKDIVEKCITDDYEEENQPQPRRINDRITIRGNTTHWGKKVKGFRMKERWQKTN